ncbi:MAG: aminotransferase class I/II-fold pyridoxal phosphate-dependent enzyme [Ilumatobacter sp.]|uniref:serine hydroxymethyltransferase n=1 Tax=Ilumatobacter sp. TaxID=1967498 RepID=UPI003297F305
MSPQAVAREAQIRSSLESTGLDEVDRRIFDLIERNREIHDRECINLNPASNVMNPRAEAVLSSGLTTRASLGHPGDKYEMGLEAIEEIEVIANELARAVFHAEYAELRVGSGALANLYAFMATCEPGDSIVVPPAEIGGHVTHRRAGAASLYGLDIHEHPIDPATFSVDLDGLAELVDRVRPKLITVGTSLNLLPHPVAEIRTIADRVGARVLFDAAHACGMIAGGVWPNPLDEGADLMTMSTYKSLGGPAGGIVFTNRADLADRLDAIAYPGLTANFDVAVTTALAITLLDWLDVGADYAHAMTANAEALAAALDDLAVPVHTVGGVHTRSHQLVVDARRWGGGGEAAVRLRRGNLLASAIGLPGDEAAGLRFGTPEITRIGMTTTDMPELAALIASGLRDPDAVAGPTSELRRRFDTVHFVRDPDNPLRSPGVQPDARPGHAQGAQR